MDAIETYAASKGWRVKRNIVLVEGTTDEALFGLADELARQMGIDLLGPEICVVAAGERDRGGTFGVGRELITLRSLAPYILDRNGFVVYKIIGLVDNDFAGRQIVENITKIDRSAIEFRDVVRLRPIMMRGLCISVEEIRRASDDANAPYCELDWEIEDTLSKRLIEMLIALCPSSILSRVSMNGRTHFELTRSGKQTLHRLAQREATLVDLVGIVDIVRCLRARLGLADIVVGCDFELAVSTVS